MSKGLMTEAQANMVSVIIPCYNQGPYLGEAIESVLRQSDTHFEIIVINDGSTDDTSEVVACYRQARCIEQPNQGLSAARNVGIRASKGKYLVFLDADDRLLPGALQAGSAYLNAHQTCVFVSGHHQNIAADGSPLRPPHLACVEQEHYRALLRGNYIGMHATVMYRREIFDVVGGFDTSLAACEDYHLYLRIARTYAIGCHHQLTAEYRRHDGSMSRDHARMLKTVLDVLNSQKTYVWHDECDAAAYREGTRFWQDLYGDLVVKDLRTNARKRQWNSLERGLLVLLRYSPRHFSYLARLVWNHMKLRLRS